MGAFGGILLLIGLFFLYKAFTAQKLLCSRYEHELGKIDSGLYAAVFLFWAFKFIFDI